jgi:hypothetical protein
MIEASDKRDVKFLLAKDIWEERASAVELHPRAEAS